MVEADDSGSGGSDAVTIVVATYNRAEVLTKALRTVRMQSHENWRCIVIGDACSDNTAEAVASLEDERFAFINLPKRFGEQAGPNSVGAALVRTPFTAFLNHDDYWLPDHLTRALTALNGADADLYWAEAAFFASRGARVDRAMFVARSPPGRTLGRMADMTHSAAEPVSAWVARTKALRRVGPWSLSTQTQMLPIKEYALRAARTGLTLACGEGVTVLKDNVVTAPPMYAGRAAYADRWLAMIEAGEVDDLLAIVDDDLWLAQHLGLTLAFHMPTIGGAASRSDVEREGGIDLAALDAQVGGPNPVLSRLLRKRTNETIADQPRLEDMVACAAAELPW